LVTGASAQVAFEVFANLLLAAVVMMCDQIHGGHHHAGRAKAALQPVAVTESGLHGVQASVSGGEPFDGGNVMTIGLNGEHIAGLYCLSIDEHSASPALRGVAADMGAGEALLLPQKLHQAGVCLNLGRNGFTVQLNGD
jgi:hypothetical protein